MWDQLTYYIMHKSGFDASFIKMRQKPTFIPSVINKAPASLLSKNDQMQFSQKRLHRFFSSFHHLKADDLRFHDMCVITLDHFVNSNDSSRYVCTFSTNMVEKN